LQQWRKNLAAGAAKFSEVAAVNRVIPPLFVWVVASAGEDLAAGFNRAAEIYHSRAIYRTEVALYSVLPIASLFLGVIVFVAGLFGHQHVFAAHRHDYEFEWQLTDMKIA